MCLQPGEVPKINDSANLPAVTHEASLTLRHENKRRFSGESLMRPASPSGMKINGDFQESITSAEEYHPSGDSWVRIYNSVHGGVQQRQGTGTGCEWSGPVRAN